MRNIATQCLSSRKIKEIYKEKRKKLTNREDGGDK